MKAIVMIGLILLLIFIEFTPELKMQLKNPVDDGIVLIGGWAFVDDHFPGLAAAYCILLWFFILTKKKLIANLMVIVPMVLAMMAIIFN